MDKKEKIFLALAYAATAILTLLPFFEVGFTNSDDFQYYNTAHAGIAHWFDDASSYAKGAGRFYFLITKYFYYVPYLIDNVLWTKFTQYVPLLACYLLFSHIVYLIFDSKRLAALTLLILVFNMSVGLDWFYVPTAYPFFFAFSFMIFLFGVLLYVNYTKKDGYWRVVLSSVLFFVSYLFYENYLVFTVVFCCCVLARNWRKTGFVPMLRNKSYYKEMVPYVVAAVVYMICYIGFRQYVLRTSGNTEFYDGTVISSNFNLSNFFTILYEYTIYTLPGRVYVLHQAGIAENSLLMSGHYNIIWYVLTHASAVAYINALLQCCVLWPLIDKANFKKLSWTAIVVGAVVASVFAFSSQILIALTSKYNWDWIANVLYCYVPTFFSYFGVMLVIALLIACTIKLSTNDVARKTVSLLWCVLLFAFSVINTYTNDNLSREWKKSQNRVTVIELISEEKFFEDKIPDNSIVYVEPLCNTSNTGLKVCAGAIDFETLVMRLSGKKYIFSQTWTDLQTKVNDCPDLPVYFVQATESKKYCELMLAFSHITQMDSIKENVVADKADVFYYSPTKDYVLFYNLSADRSMSKSVNVISKDKHRKVTHVSLEEDEGLNPLGFSVSNIVVPTADTIYLP